MRASGQRRSAGRGHRRLPIAHNETALSAGSGAEGKHGEEPGPDRKRRGTAAALVSAPGRRLVASLPDSPPGWALGFPRPRGAYCPAPRYVGAVLLGPPRPGCAPGALGFESVSSLCVGAPALAGETPEPCQWPSASCFLVPAAASEPVARCRCLHRLGTPLVETEAHRGGAAEWGRKRSGILRRIVVGVETGLVWGWGLRNRVSQLALSLGRKLGPLE